jgi:tetratricopeptide (TPR) repeat protein
MAWDPGTANSPNVRGLFSAHYEDHEALQDYALGLLSLEIGDGGGFLTHSSKLGRYAPDEEGRKKGQVLWQSLRARELLQNGDASGAVSQFRNVENFLPLELIPASPFYSRALDRWLLAEVLREQGLLNDALAWYETLSDGWGEFLLAAPAHLRQGEIHAELGNRQEAIDHFKRFEELWKDANEPLAKFVHRSREARAKLEAEGGR